MTSDDEVFVLFEASGYLFGVEGVRRVSITFLHIRNEVVWLPWGHVLIEKEEMALCRRILLFCEGTSLGIPQNSEEGMNGGTVPNAKHLPIGKSMFILASGS